MSNKETPDKEVGLPVTVLEEIQREEAENAKNFDSLCKLIFLLFFGAFVISVLIKYAK